MLQHTSEVFVSSGEELVLESGAEGLLPPLIFNLFPPKLQVLYLVAGS